MNRLLRWLLRGVLATAVLGVLALAVVWVLIAGSLPEYEGQVITDVRAPVEIVRDANALPHIRAETARDVWFALGLVHAQDRLWQMEVARRSAQGRLSELLGARTVSLDRLVRTLDLYGYATRAVAHQSAAAQEALTAYAAGVNAWIRHVDAEALGRGAPEFYFYGQGLAPWRPADSLAILKMMALRLTNAASLEVRRAQFQLALPAARVADILPEYPSPAVLSVPRYGALFPGAHFGDATAPPSDPLTQALGPAARPELSGASNAWAVDASRSSSRHPLLASDPHLWLSAPGVWYLADLGAEGLSAIGGTLPGVPLVLIGHNTRLGWGLTTANVDDQDLFIEQLNPSDPNQYLTPLGWADFETRRVRIEVAGGEALVETVRATRHGPVLGEDMLGEGSVTPEGYVAALAWTALVEEDRSYSAALDLMRAESIEAAIEAAAGVVAPAQVLTLADESGVALHMAGRVPRRSPDSAARGRIPAPGWKSENDWQGFFPASAAPSVVSPEEGAVATANNRLSDAPFPRHISHDWAPPYRIRRLEKELAERRFHSRDSFQALQNDTVSEMARSVLPLIARDLWWREGQPAASGQRAEALALLAEWNGEMDRHSPEPLIFLEWMRWLTRRLALDELGGLLAQVSGPRPVFVERVFRDVDGAGIWCDIDKTPQIEPCSLAAELALDDALTRLTRDYGSDIAGWRWGEAHSAIHRHMPFGFVPGLGLLFNIEHETSGSNHTLMRGAGEGGERDPFRNVHASGLRLVLDFADLDRSLGMISTGQSGHPFSQWYDHLADAWARGDAIALSRSMEEARSGSVGTLRVLPRATP